MIVNPEPRPGDKVAWIAMQGIPWEVSALHVVVTDNKGHAYVARIADLWPWPPTWSQEGETDAC